MAIKMMFGSNFVARALSVCVFVAIPLATEAKSLPNMRLAQLDLRPPDNVPSGGNFDQRQPDSARDLPADNQNPQGGEGDSGADSSSLLLRIDRLQDQIRKMTGRIEELNHRQTILEQKLQAAQINNANRPADVRPPALAHGNGDAFDPSVSPGSVGVPRALGQGGNQSVPLEPNPADQPLKLSDGAGGEVKKPFGRPLGLDTSAPPATAAPSGPRAQYEAALTLFRGGRYAEAEQGFTNILSANPKGSIKSDSIFYLGESYFRRHLNRQAAEQYLKLSTDYPKSGKAPESLVRLGMSLQAMGAKEQACAALGEVARKYPKSLAAVREAHVEAERDHC
ncbi:MAG: tol-pal system protein YbgF [Hyphomicrobiales bacterium]|nr:tol-pal system protein YbgF [Hyphomicrobiales bacterium]MDE2114828.1 tol-pal system protein YbgF [Hyphomicrobiales bacterium]